MPITVVVPGNRSQLLCIASHPNAPVFVTGAQCGMVSVWDYSTNRKVGPSLPYSSCLVVRLYSV
jgi:hypothetical protein